MKKGLMVASFVIVGFFFNACATHSKSNITYENKLAQKVCDIKFIDENLKEIKNNNDVIYKGLNIGLIAKDCGEFQKSNELFDIVEESYKYDVDLQSIGGKGTKLLAQTLLNESVLDYEGSLYERIMVNSYKGLNFMSLGDYKNARVEFNRALLRQDKAKEYFATEIEQNRKEVEKAKKDENYNKNVEENTKTINQEYTHLWTEFNTTKDFINPYATYLASVFFYMDKDYKRANDLFREISIINPKNKEIQKEAKIFKQAARSKKARSKKYVFVVYENGFGAIKDKFELTLPFVLDNKVITTSVALQTIKKRESSYPNLLINNNTTTTEIVNLDDIIATEFKINMPTMITKALLQTLTKTTINAVVAKNDTTGGILSLATSITNTIATTADVRSWRGLPKSISVVAIENNGTINIKTPSGENILTDKVDANKDVLITIKSLSTSLPASINIIQR